MTNNLKDTDNIVLHELSDKNLIRQMHDDLYDGLSDEIVEGIEILLKRGWEPYDALTKALDRSRWYRELH